MAELNATVVTAELSSLSASVASLTTQITNGYGNLDSFYLLVVGCLVFFMQAGFGMLEAGTVRAKNTKNILLKNMLDACIGAIIWWGWGYGVAVCRYTYPPPRPAAVA